MTQAQIISILLQCLPDPGKMLDLYLSPNGNGVYFNYESIRFKVEVHPFHVDNVSRGGFLHGSLESRLLTKLILKQQQLNDNGK